MELLKFKWYDKVEKAQRQNSFIAPDPPVPFDLEDLNQTSFLKKLFAPLLAALLGAIVFVCWLTGLRPRIGSVVLVARRRDVLTVLQTPEVFHVPYGPEMRELGGAPFLLGVDGAQHERLRKIVGPALNGGPDDLVADTSRRMAQLLVKASNGQIDVMKDLITRVATETCIRTFGWDVSDPDEFADWTLAVSNLLFADPTGDPVARRLAVEAGARLRGAARRSLRIARGRLARGDTVLDRLLDSDMEDDEICSTMIGLAAGFIPTTTLAAGNILQALLARSGRMATAIDRAKAYDITRRIAQGGKGTAQDRAAAAAARTPFDACLWEAARLKPALSLGQFRYACAIAPDSNPAFVFKGGWGACRIKTGDVVIADTAAAFSWPWTFNPDRWRPGRDMPGALMFGTGPHACLGQQMAMSVTAEIFAVLLSQPGVRAKGGKGKLRSVGPFPRQLWMEFDGPPQGLGMLSICVPVQTDDLAELRRELKALGPHTNKSLARRLDATGLVHFASLALIDAGEQDKPQPFIVLELNADGEAETVIERVVAKAAPKLRRIFAFAEGRHGKLPSDGELIDLLSRHRLKHTLAPIGSTGLLFTGIEGSTVYDIERQESLARFAAAALEHYNHGPGFLAPPMAAVQAVRKLLRDPNDEAWDTETLQPFASSREQMAEYLIRPSRSRPKFTAWSRPGNAAALMQVARSNPVFWIAVLALHAVIATVTLVAVVRPHAPVVHLPVPSSLHAAGALVDILLLWMIRVVAWIGALLVSFAGSVLGALVVEASVIGLLVWVLRRKERSDIADDRAASLESVREIARIENHPGYAQNHFMAVTTLKPGFFRRVTLALAMFGVWGLVNFVFRPGFVATLGTIHYAKWFTLPGTRKQIFQANYDGSWESYLEDFITRAHQGQSAVWSNSLGFPDTRYLISGGAEDGDRFKRYVRRVQVATQFWYSRFPTLTTNRIRNNALIHDGLIHAVTDTDARAWLTCFGSMPRPEFSIESAQVQNLVFRGMPEMKFAKIALLSLPSSAERRGKWLRALAHAAPEGTAAAALEPVQFGDFPAPGAVAVSVAFTAEGLRKLGLHEKDGEPGLATFPPPFALGMSKRRRVLGDPLEDRWRWSDDKVEAALLVFGKTEEDCAQALEQHRTYLGVEPMVIDTGPAFPGDGGRLEHFGFRDGISQPVIRGTRRAAAGAPSRDLVAPGEFIFGYRSNQGYFPLSPLVDLDSDVEDQLPTPAAQSEDAFPRFGGAGPLQTVRDLGRNGSFLVIRQLQQHVDVFRRATEASAKQLNCKFPRLQEVVGEPVDADWVASKLVGRRKDGRPMVGTTGRPKPEKESAESYDPAHDRPDNDFSFGLDDPQGLQCPFGAHVRRSNPRDSLLPGDSLELKISNRHRLLRRGRSYEGVDESGQPEKGLMFICLCSDLERQFEFVQQTWVNSPNFHGLSREPDPILGGPAPGRQFTIPTTSGAVAIDGLDRFVTTKAGGYFFLPSRAAIQYLAALQTPAGRRVAASAGARRPRARRRSLAETV